MNEFTNKMTNIVTALAELSAIDDPKNPPCTVVLQSGLSANNTPAMIVKMWLPTEGEKNKMDAYELTSEGNPETVTELLDGAMGRIRDMIRKRQGGLN